MDSVKLIENVPSILTRDTDTVVLYVYDQVGIVATRAERDNRGNVHLAILQTVVYHIGYNVLKGNPVTHEHMVLSF